MFYWYSHELVKCIGLLLSYKMVPRWYVIIVGNLAMFSPMFFNCFLSIPLCSFQCNPYVLYNVRKPNSFLEKMDKQLMKLVRFVRIGGLRAHGRLCFFCRWSPWALLQLVSLQGRHLLGFWVSGYEWDICGCQSLTTSLLPAVCGIFSMILESLYTVVGKNHFKIYREVIGSS